jgi:hypothetical protein
MLTILVDLYVSLIIPAFLISLIVLDKKYPKYLRVFIVILGCDLVLEAWANYWPIPFSLERNGLYNVVMLVEFWGYGFYFWHVLHNKTIRRIIRVYLILFPVIWGVLVFFVAGFNTWNSHVAVAGSIVMIVLSAWMYYQLFTQEPMVKLINSFAFWIATALIVFFSCNFTYLGTLNFLSNLDRATAHRLLIMLQLSNVLFYSLITCAFIQLYRTIREDGKAISNNINGVS